MAVFLIRLLFRRGFFPPALNASDTGSSNLFGNTQLTSGFTGIETQGWEHPGAAQTPFWHVTGLFPGILEPPTPGPLSAQQLSSLGELGEQPGPCSAPLSSPSSPLPAPSYREGVDEDPQEEQQNEEHDGQDEHPLVPPPQDVLQGLVRGGEPQEGGLWAPAAK